MGNKLNRNLPNDVPWIEAQTALSRAPHAPVVMMSLQSLGPIKDWCCPICARYGVAFTTYSYTTEPPICIGGSEYL